MEKEQRLKLAELIQENPNMEIICKVDEEINNNIIYSWNVGKILNVHKGKCYYDGEFYFQEKERLVDHLCTDELYLENLEIVLDTIPKKEVIWIEIGGINE